MDIEIRSAENATRIIMSGPFTFNDSPMFREVVDRLKQSAPGDVTIDLSALDFIDSDGLGMLLLLREVAEKHSFSLTLQYPTGHIKTMFDLWNFNSLFTIESDTSRCA